MFVPVMPTTVFFIIALWAFKKSSPRLEAWLLNHPLFGPPLRDWEEHHCIRPRAKAIALTMIWLTIGASTYLMVQREKWGVAGILITVAIGVTYYILTRPSGPADAPKDPPLAASVDNSLRLFP